MVYSTMVGVIVKVSLRNRLPLWLLLIFMASAPSVARARGRIGVLSTWAQLISRLKIRIVERAGEH
jgi:hypothetical protein